MICFKQMMHITSLPAWKETGKGFFVRSSLHLRSAYAHPPFILRSSSIMPPLCLRFVNGGRSSSQRRMIEFTTKDERRMNEGRTKEYGDVTIEERGYMSKSALFVFLLHYLFDMLVYSVDLGYICICLIPLYIYIA